MLINNMGGAGDGGSRYLSIYIYDSRKDNYVWLNGFSEYVSIGGYGRTVWSAIEKGPESIMIGGKKKMLVILEKLNQYQDYMEIVTGPVGTEKKWCLIEVTKQTEQIYEWKNGKSVLCKETERIISKEPFDLDNMRVREY